MNDKPKTAPEKGATKPEPKPIIITRPCKHEFTRDELIDVGRDLSRAITLSNNLDGEFAAVKKTYQGKIETATSEINRLSSLLDAGFEVRMASCRVVFDVANRTKTYFNCETDADEGTDPMSPDDLQRELFQAEAAFEDKAVIKLFDAKGSSGECIVGRYEGSWYSAVRQDIGGKVLEQRLDSMQRSFKNRWDAIQAAVKSAAVWIEENHGTEVAKGFAAGFAKVIEKEKDKVE